MIATISVAFLFPKTSFVKYDLQVIAILFILLFTTKRFFKFTRLFESVIFTLVIFIIINTTGGVSSPFFFLVYFLLFSISLLLEPVISIITSFTSVIFFMIFLSENQSINTLLPVFSLVFLTPFALYMGKEHMKSEFLKQKNQNLTKDTFLFLSLMIKNHLKNIKSAIENFMGDHELSQIKKSTGEMEKLIEKFESEEEIQAK
jgi:hypothetical protein